jgi:hypothetical protein
VSPQAAVALTGEVVPSFPFRWRSFNAYSVRRTANLLGVLILILVLVAALLLERRPALPPPGDELLPSYVALVLALIVIHVFVRRSVAPVDRDWLTALCRLAFFVRVLVAMAIYYGPWDFYMLAEDQMGYDHLAPVVAKYWSGELPRPPFMSESGYLERVGYYTLVAAQQYLFGATFMMPRVLNCLAGTLIVLYAYRLALHVFGAPVAKVVAVWTAYFPSLILWSTLNMRDIWLALGVVVVIYHALRVRERFSLSAVLVIGLNLIWIQYVRFPLVIILMGALCAVFGLARAQRFGRDLAVALLILAGVVFLQRGLGIGKEGMEWLDLQKIAANRSKYANASVGASGYLGDFDLTSPGVLVAFMPLSLAYFLFSPFPWQMTGRRLVTLPEMLVWYWSVPFVLAAAAEIFRDRGGRRLALLLPTLLISMAFAVGSANIGLSYRYRAQVMSLFLAFAAAGYVKRRARLSASPGS